VKTVLSDSNILKEILAKKQVSNVETDTGPASSLQTKAICQLKDDSEKGWQKSFFIYSKWFAN